MLVLKTMHIAAALAAVCAAGCIQVKTESEIKPIHITMDVNLKVDKELDKAFADENQQKPKGDFAAVKAMLDRQAAGVTNRAMLEARDKATDADHLLIAESNARRLKRFSDVAKSNGISLETVQRRHAAKMRERIAAGSGVWFQDDSGKWLQR